MTHSTTATNRNHLLGILLGIALWEIACHLIGQAIYLPSPYQVLLSLRALLGSQATYHILLVSSLRVLASFAIAAFSGIVIGTFAGLNRSLAEFLEPLVALFRSIPVISIIILAIIWLPSTQVPVFSGFLMCFPLIYISMVNGIRQTDPQLLEMARVYRLGKAATLQRIYWPSALPYLKTGMTGALGLSWKVIAAAEVLSLPRYAVGSRLHDAKVYLQIPDLYAWTVLIILLSFLFNRGLDQVFSRARSIRR